MVATGDTLANRDFNLAIIKLKVETVDSVTINSSRKRAGGSGLDNGTDILSLIPFK
jgi:hypothetical protein